MTRKYVVQHNGLLASLALCAIVAVLPARGSAQEIKPDAKKDTTKAAAQIGPSVGPPIQVIATASAVSKEAFGGIDGVRELPDGKVLVNDSRKRRLLLMDTTLTTLGVVLDSLTDVANAYGIRGGSLLPYYADSTLFVDQAALAMLVIDPAGKLTRVRSIWRVQDIYLAMPGQYGWPGFDAKGRLVYRMPAQVNQSIMMAAMNSTTPFYPPSPDSAFIVAADLETRKLDTLGILRIPSEQTFVRKEGNGMYFERVTNPLPRTDEWAILPDGRIAFVRAIDYRIDYLHPDGKWTSSEKLPYEWQRLMDEDKQKFVDSVRILQEKQNNTSFVAATIRWVNMYNGKYPANFKVPEGFVPPPGMPKDWIVPPGFKFPENYVYACAPGQSAPPATPPAPPPAPGASPAGPAVPAAPTCLPAPPVLNYGNGAPPPPTQRPVNMVEANTLPDYRPPFLSNAVRADEDNNLWIRFVQNKTIPGGPVYDIVNPEGKLVNRIQLPTGYTLIGFGKGKIVYLQMRDATGNHLARVRLK